MYKKLDDKKKEKGKKEMKYVDKHNSFNMIHRLLIGEKTTWKECY